ncbi:MAG: hypothetical protein GC162_09300 [Planctomycetes bacterium]|nr:hypothetical protein [Planctomycetota bacterium]
MTSFHPLRIGRAVLTMTLLTASVVWGADAPQAEKPAAPAAAPEQAGAAMTTEITSVTGLVQVRQGEDQPWVKATVGMKLDNGAEFRTGPRSTVEFKVGDTQIVKLDRLGTIKVLDAIKANGAIKMDLGLKYGRSELRVEAGGVEHESVIHAPTASLAVRGSAGAMVTDAFQTIVYCTEHEASAIMHDANGLLRHIPLPNKVLTTDKDANPIKTALRTNTFNPQKKGSTDTEDELNGENPDGTYRDTTNDITDEVKGNKGTQMEEVYHHLSEFDG